MKKQSTKHCFPYRFTKAMLALCIASLVLCIVGIGVSVYRMIRFGVKDFNDFIRYPFLVIVCVFAVAVIIALLVRSQYVVTQEKLYSNFGFLKSSVDVSKITAIVCDAQEDKATVYLGEAYFVVTLPKGENEKLAAALGVTPTYLTGWEEERPHTLAAHFEGEEFSEDELREIEKFVQFVKSRRTQ